MICYYFREAFLNYFPLKAAVLIFSLKNSVMAILCGGQGKNKLSKAHSALTKGLYLFT